LAVTNGLAYLTRVSVSVYNSLIGLAPGQTRARGLNKQQLRKKKRKKEA
jgi:hypothetical protein